MRFRPPILKPRWILLVLAEAILATAMVVVGGWADREARAQGPESALMAYAVAIGRHDLEGALDQLAPPLRTEARDWVAWQLGNRYTILESAVRDRSLLDQLTGRETVQPLVIVTMEVDAEDGTHWRATEEVRVRFVDGRWYLLKPPLKEEP